MVHGMSISVYLFCTVKDLDYLMIILQWVGLKMHHVARQYRQVGERPMLQILLVDDERSVVETLAETIPWESCGSVQFMKHYPVQ